MHTQPQPIQPQPTFQTLLSFFKVLADESRLKLIGLLAQQERSVEEMAALLSLKEPTVSHHLARLKQMELVTVRPEKNARYYRLNQDALQTLSKGILAPDNIASFAEDVDVDAAETKILNNYFENGQLKSLPASRKKRWVILKWLANQFETEKTYPEKEINATLKQFHPDVATLRRELIGYQMMQREKGTYWRLPEADWRTEAEQN
ncbi:MAG: metalloregulator ArsR/SmtB family transcription factor [Cyanobacteria bacterium J06626_23]